MCFLTMNVNVDWQLAVVLVVVAVCVLVALRGVWRAMHGRADCGCGRGGDCPLRASHGCDCCNQRDKVVNNE